MLLHKLRAIEGEHFVGQCVALQKQGRQIVSRLFGSLLLAGGAGHATGGAGPPRLAAAHTVQTEAVGVTVSGARFGAAVFACVPLFAHTERPNDFRVWVGGNLAGAPHATLVLAHALITVHTPVPRRADAATLQAVPAVLAGLPAAAVLPVPAGLAQAVAGHKAGAVDTAVRSALLNFTGHALVPRVAHTLVLIAHTVTGAVGLAALHLQTAVHASPAMVAVAFAVVAAAAPQRLGAVTITRTLQACRPLPAGLTLTGAVHACAMPLGFTGVQTGGLLAVFATPPVLTRARVIPHALPPVVAAAGAHARGGKGALVTLPPRQTEALTIQAAAMQKTRLTACAHVAVNARPALLTEAQRSGFGVGQLFIRHCVHGELRHADVAGTAVGAVATGDVRQCCNHQLVHALVQVAPLVVHARRQTLPAPAAVVGAYLNTAVRPSVLLVA